MTPRHAQSLDLLRIATRMVCALLLAASIDAMHRVMAQEPDGQSTPQSSPKSKSSALDDALLDDLDNELLEGAGDLQAPPQPGGSTRKVPRDKQPNAAGEAELIDDTMPAEDADPLVYISREMRAVEESIPHLRRRLHAEQLQQRIIDDLARLIEQAESQRSQASPSSKNRKSSSATKRRSVQQPKQSPGNSGKNSDKPAEDSTNRLGRAEAARPDPELFRQMMKETWGHLPPRDREQMLQNTPDKFLPKYELLIEQYYKRLAEDPPRK
jgi:hypothetical protein